MIPYDTPSVTYEEGPQTALTPEIVAHGAGGIGAEYRVIRGNPVGHIVAHDGSIHPYLSAAGEHSHLPVERAMLASDHYMIDDFRLSQKLPAAISIPPPRWIKLTRSILNPWRWPDTSISAGVQSHAAYYGGHPAAEGGQEYPVGQPYGAEELVPPGYVGRGGQR